LSTDDPRRALPSVDAALSQPAIAELVDRHPRGQVVDAVRATIAERRQDGTGVEGLAGDVAARLRPSLRRVINATGVILHTNLGRAPLAPQAAAAVADAMGTSNLEWNTNTGERGSRQDHVVEHLQALTGAELAAVANTNAGGMLLALVALASGKEVIVSRGQLVEIGGGFRVPEVLTASGCRLVEVGTTNKTRIADYERAITTDTAVLLRVHPSNFRVVGFTEEARLDELVALAHSRGLLVIDDLGSGALSADPIYRGEPDVRTSVAAGVDVTCFSSDKLMGGPQGGLLVGRAEAIERCRKHPLMRALRPDKLTIAALEATLAVHRDPDTARRDIPTLAMLAALPELLRERAERLAAVVGGEAVATIGRVGGGSLPTEDIPSFAVALDSADGADALAARLRDCDPHVAARVVDGRVVLDVLTLSPDDLVLLPDLLESLR
jgi:L-seryl-tRNA(Ser) seleniumtransferase